MMMRGVVMVGLLCIAHLGSLCVGKHQLHVGLPPLHPIQPTKKLLPKHGTPSPGSSPSIPPDMWPKTALVPVPSPASSPNYHSFPATPGSRHHGRIHHVVPPTSDGPSQNQDCGILCSDPLTRTPIGSPCGCVLPLQVVIDLGVAPFLLFTNIAELEMEVAAGTFLKQSQVKIMAALPITPNQEKTRVTIYLVPLGEKFDRTTALLIYERLWQKKLHLNNSIFGNCEVISVDYPGLPSSPPSMPEGPSPSDSGIHQYPFTADLPSGKTQKLTAGIIAVIAVSSFMLVLACIGVVYLVLKWKRRGRPPTVATALGPVVAPSRKSGIRCTVSNSIASSTSGSFISTVAACPPSVKTFSLAELQKATDQFSSKKILGEGGFGRVYHGILEGGSEVAVKLLSKGDRNGDREFIAEVEMLSRLHHRNLVKLIGICIEGDERCLVYELVRNGSVESHLHGADKEKGPLDWDARMKIALGAARGLAYLHEDSNPHVIHRDFKASNVLLEEDFTPKVTDFGLAREASEGSRHISTRVMGTFGYVAPEYAMTGHLLVKSDVYSYGVVLLELLSGRKPVYMSGSQGPRSLVTWARPLLTSKEGVEKIVDPSLHGNYDFDDVAKVASIASMCVHTEPSQRPFMGEVVQALKLIYNDMDETCADSHSHGESFSCPDYDYTGDFGPQSSWWRNRGSQRLAYGHNSPFMSMEYSWDLMEEMRRPYSASALDGRVEFIAGPIGSGPLRPKRNRTAFHKLRGNMSFQGHLPRPPDSNANYISSL